jgi:hypothetical protein
MSNTPILPPLPELPGPDGGLDEFGAPIYSADQIKSYARVYARSAIALNAPAGGVVDAQELIDEFAKVCFECARYERPSAGWRAAGDALLKALAPAPQRDAPAGEVESCALGDTTQDELDEASRFMTASREAKNMVAETGYLNRAFNAILESNEPDAIHAHLVQLAHCTVDLTLSVGTNYPADEPAPLAHRVNFLDGSCPGGWVSGSTSIGAEGWLRRDKSAFIEYAYASPPLSAQPAAEPVATTADTWPIVKINVHEGRIILAEFYTPGLPDGEHDLWPVRLTLTEEDEALAKAAEALVQAANKFATPQAQPSPEVKS